MAAMQQAESERIDRLGRRCRAVAGEPRRCSPSSHILQARTISNARWPSEFIVEAPRPIVVEQAVEVVARSRGLLAWQSCGRGTCVLRRYARCRVSRRRRASACRWFGHRRADAAPTRLFIALELPLDGFPGEGVQLPGKFERTFGREGKLFQFEGTIVFINSFQPFSRNPTADSPLPTVVKRLLHPESTPSSC